jgi:CDP-glycerol glycerophosphotransferase (TagB/SpsB family)
VPDLVRAAVTRSDGYWEALSAELARLLDLLSDETFRAVPVEDRVIAWLCAHDHREAAESFLEYAFDNQNGYPHRVVGDRPQLTFPFIDEIHEASAALTGTADSELRYRSRLLTVGWTEPTVLRIEGAAFIEYLDDDYAESLVTLVLRDRDSDREWRVPTQVAPERNVNGWSTRAHEDHTRSAFRCDIDVTRLPPPGREPTVLDVELELTVGAHTRVGGFQARAFNESAGLLEPSVVDRTVAQPLWRPFGGLSLELRTAKRADLRPPVETVAVRILDFSAGDRQLTLEGESDRDPEEPLEISLVGPRGSTGWVRAAQRAGRFTVSIDAFENEWGVASTALPADRYAVRARTPGGELLPVAPARSFWRSLPRSVGDSGLLFVPFVSVEGHLLIRVIPEEWPSSRPPYYRRRLRDVSYPEARLQPLLDVALFETFAGKAAGDNPGALAKDLAGRDEDVELVFSVIDRSVEVPAGSRSVIRFSREYFELLGRARYLIVNASLPYFFRKREGQLYFQTWHGSPLKRIAHDRPHLDFFNWHHRRQLLIARDGWDYLLSQSEFCTRALRSAFRYDGAVMELGYPRNDLMMSAEADDVRRRTREHFGIAEDQRLVLYAPTWRDNLRVGRVFEKVLYLDPHELVDRLDNTVVLVRGHYNSMRAAENVDPDNRVIDVTRYPDIADLYVAADAMVTDYSSVFFDFVLTDKPMVFLAPDLKEYRDDNRGFYLDYDVVPGPICLTTADVVSALGGPDEHVARRAEFRKEFAPHDDGSAAARVIDAILERHPYR